MLGDYWCDIVQDSSDVNEAQQELQNFIYQQSSAKSTSESNAIIILSFFVRLAAAVLLWVWKNKPERIPWTDEYKQKAVEDKQKADDREIATDWQTGHKSGVASEFWR